MAVPPRKRLGEMLLETGVIDAAQLQAALGHQRRWGGRLGQALVDLKVASEAQIVDTLARKLGYEPMLLSEVEYGPSLELALRLVPHAFAERHVLLPYAADSGSISVAMSDPTNVAVVDELAFRTGRKVKVSIAGDREISAAVKRLYLGEKRHLDAIAIDDADEGPVEVLGPLEAVHPAPLDAFFARPAAPGTPPGSPPPLPGGAGPAPAPHARLAAGPHGLRLEDERTGGRGLAARAGPPPADESPTPRLSVILDDLDGLGRTSGTPPELARFARTTAAVVRALLRKGVLEEQDLVDEILRR